MFKSSRFKVFLLSVHYFPEKENKKNFIFIKQNKKEIRIKFNETTKAYSHN